MFKAPFSFDGRIRRMEFGISFIIYIIGLVIQEVIIGSGDGTGAILSFIIIIPLIWFLWAQGAKRCHDLGRSG
jgi:uncharacterized membrane protein YhaH (DUF805 family)